METTQRMNAFRIHVKHKKTGDTQSWVFYAHSAQEAIEMCHSWLKDADQYILEWRG